MIQDISKWLYRKSRNLDFGELSVKLKIHDGEIVQVDKSENKIERPKSDDQDNQDDHDMEI